MKINQANLTAAALIALSLSACGGGSSSSGGSQDQGPLSVNGNPPSGAIATSCIATARISADQVRFTNNCNFRINVNIFRASGTSFFGLDPSAEQIARPFNDGEVVACESPFVPAQGASGPFCQA